MHERKILVVDDNELLRWGMTRGLSSPGFCVSASGTIRSAEDAIASDRHSIVFLDVRLPDGNGFDLLDRIHAEFPATRVVLMTAHESEGDRDRALQAGAFRFLPKPFSISDAREIVEEIVCVEARQD